MGTGGGPVQLHEALEHPRPVLGRDPGAVVGDSHLDTLPATGAAETSMSPGGAYLMAFSTRLVRTWRSLVTSVVSLVEPVERSTTIRPWAGAARSSATSSSRSPSSTASAMTASWRCSTAAVSSSSSMRSLEPPTLPVGDAEELLLGLPVHPVLEAAQGLDRAEHGRQRGAQLVGDRGEELVLLAVQVDLMAQGLLHPLKRRRWS